MEVQVVEVVRAAWLELGGQGVCLPLLFIHSVCPPALHPGSSSCNSSPPSLAHPNPFSISLCFRGTSRCTQASESH